MITINSFLHRARLRDLVRRWLFGELQSGDMDDLLRLVHFNNVFVSRYLERFADQLFAGLHGDGLHTQRVATKGELRDLVCAHLPPHCPRGTQLAAAYARDPGQYFRETPFQGRLYFINGTHGIRYAGSSRIKRIRRLAEKSARRLVDWCYDATALPADRDEPELQEDRQLLARLRQLRDIPAPERVAINDVAGIKLVLEQQRIAALPARLQAYGCTLIEQEHHTGRYCATNLVVEFRPDPADILTDPLHERMLQVFAAHGYSANRANAAFREFVHSGEDSVSLEIIATGYLEMLESEVGSCMHEERIIRQRRNPRYDGQLAQNIGFLMEYMFTLPALPWRRLERLPLRIGDRYLPDYFDEVRRRMFGNPSVELHEL